jgi:hypothetical protein
MGAMRRSPFRIAVGGSNRPDRGRRRVEYVTGYPPGTILIIQSANTIPPDQMGNLSPRALVLSLRRPLGHRSAVFSLQRKLQIEGFWDYLH